MREGRFQTILSAIENKVGKLGPFKKLWVIADYSYERIINGVQKADFFKYEFYYKNRAGRTQFLTGKEKKAFFDQVNELGERKYFDDKALFFDEFKDFMGREELSLETSTLEEFTALLKKKNKLFIKPIDGHFGIGAQIIEAHEDSEILQLYKQFSGQRIIAEEVIVQAPQMAKFNDTTVNTLRVITFVLSNGEPVVLPYAAMRLGRKGKIADNFHNDGICAMIDTATGYVITTGLDQHGNRWVVHPDSKEPIVGFMIPHWEKVCECVKKAALVRPKVRCVGWDVVITEDERVILVEGNSRPDPDVIQAVDGVGKANLFKTYMNAGTQL